MNKFFSVVVPVNNKEIFDRNISESLNKQNNADYDLFVIDSINNKYKCAGEALNSVASLLSGEYVVFCHQDLNFDENFLGELRFWCEKTNLDVAGLVGKVKINGKYEIVTEIVHTEKKIPAGTYSNFLKPIETQTLDECIIIIKRTVFEKYKFKYFADTWHLYATEYCLQMKQEGIKVYVLPIKAWHNSKYGSLNKEYFKNLQILCEKYRKNKYIITIYGIWPTNPLLCYLKCLYRMMKIRKVV